MGRSGYMKRLSCFGIGAIVLVTIAACSSNGGGSSDADIAKFAMDVCRAVVTEDESAYLALHVNENDFTRDGQLKWVSYAGAQVSDFEPWRELSKAHFRKQMKWLGDNGLAARDLTCDKVLSIDRSASPTKHERKQGRVYGVTVNVTSPRMNLVLGVGTTVAVKRGRAFQGPKEPQFISWRMAGTRIAAEAAQSEAPAGRPAGDR